MSFRLKRFLPKLLDRLRHLERPVFTERELREADAESFALLRKHKVLVTVGSCEYVDHDVHGSMGVTWIGERPFLFDPDHPSREWIEIERDDIRRFVFSHEAMMRWIASSNDMDGQSIAKGVIWTIGTKTINGTRCHVLYYPGTQDCNELLLALRDYDLGASEAKTPKLLITPAPLPLPDAELRRLDELGIQIEQLYGLVGDNTIDLQRASVSVPHAAKLYVFRRAGKNWEIGFETKRPIAIPDKKGMSEIWLLLRNPGKEFKAYEITNELNALDPSQAPVRSAGTTPRSASATTPEAKNKIFELRREIELAKDSGNEVDLKYAQEELDDFLEKLGIRDSYRGVVQQESNDFKKERESMAKAMKRTLDRMDTREAADLQAHLRKYIHTGEVFSYSPPEMFPWQTQ